MTPDRIRETDPRLAGVLKLLKASFAYMDGIIDPPSSIQRLTLSALRKACAISEIWATHDTCMILTPQTDTLYLGKLAVAEKVRGQGHARHMINHAEQRGKVLGLETITLQTRIELHANQAAFKALGFQEVARTRHPGYTRDTSITYMKSVDPT